MGGPGHDDCRSERLSAELGRSARPGTVDSASRVRRGTPRSAVARSSGWRTSDCARSWSRSASSSKQRSTRRPPQLDTAEGGRATVDQIYESVPWQGSTRRPSACRPDAGDVPGAPGTIEPDRQVREGGNMKRAVRLGLVIVGRRRPDHRTDPTGRCDAAVSLVNTPLAVGTQYVRRDHPAPGGNQRRHGTDHGRPGRILGLALASGRRDRGRPAGLAHGVRLDGQSLPHRHVHRGSVVHRATWRSDERAQHGRGAHTPCSSPSRVCLWARCREPTSRTRAPVQVSDDLTE